MIPPTLCRVCGEKIEDAGEGRSLCYGCHLDSLVPAGYSDRERYVYDTATRLSRATCRPKTGLMILDLPSSVRSVAL